MYGAQTERRARDEEGGGREAYQKNCVAPKYSTEACSWGSDKNAVRACILKTYVSHYVSEVGVCVRHEPCQVARYSTAQLKYYTVCAIYIFVYYTWCVIIHFFVPSQ